MQFKVTEKNTVTGKKKDGSTWVAMELVGINLKNNKEVKQKVFQNQKALAAAAREVEVGSVIALNYKKDEKGDWKLNTIVNEDPGEYVPGAKRREGGGGGDPHGAQIGNALNVAAALVSAGILDAGKAEETLDALVDVVLKLGERKKTMLMSGALSETKEPSVDTPVITDAPDSNDDDEPVDF